MALPLGVGATCEVILKHLKPNKYIKFVYPNPEPGQRLGGLVAFKKEVRRINKKEQICIVFRHDEFPNKELFCVKRWVRVTAAGDPTQLFVDEVAEQNEWPNHVGRELPQRLQEHSSGTRFAAEDMQTTRAEGFMVDDDNEPAPENNNKDNNNKTLEDYHQAWVPEVSTSYRKQEGFHNTQPKINSLGVDILTSMTLFSMFLLFIPWKFIKEVLLKKTSERLLAVSQRAVTFGEFLRCLAWFLVLHVNNKGSCPLRFLLGSSG